MSNSSAPSIDYRPQTLEALRARYPRALETLFDVRETLVEGGVRPGQLEANVFDFEDGLRLIISREIMAVAPQKRVLHISASFRGDCRIADEWKLLLLTQSLSHVYVAWVEDLPRRFRELSGDDRELLYAFTSSRLVPHFFIDETPKETV